MPFDPREVLDIKPFQGKNGRYRILNTLGAGGNGIVFEVELENSDKDKGNNSYAIKLFYPSRELDNERRIERFERFKTEIEVTQRLQKQVFGLVPILDYHISDDAFSGLTWYLMPKAMRYHFSNYFERNIDELISLGEIIRKLHRKGIDHRDIKPGNLLYYNRSLALSDLGLCFDENADSHLTGSGEVLGPVVIRPPELEEHRNIPEDIDFKKSDVYLFAKTAWMAIAKNKSGFRGEYNRKDPQIYLDKKNIQAETLEPIHRMMEESTYNDFRRRISIEKCLDYLYLQKSINDNSIDTSTLNTFKCNEALGVANALDPDVRQFNSPELVSQVLKRLNDFSFFVCVRDVGRNKLVGKLDSIAEINNRNDYSIRLYDDKIMRYKSVILRVSRLNLSKRNSVIETGQCDNTSENVKECFTVKDVLEPGHDTYLLRGKFTIVFDSRFDSV